ncbi:MAG TPA: PAS domain-containing protein [Roseiflexaceae bacterium]|nr:PAS domain-containing protein [Roseiflexaceae bacterium]
MTTHPPQDTLSTDMQLRERVAMLEHELAAERERARQLTEQVGLLSQTLDLISDLVLIKGEKSRIVHANKAFRELYGMSQEEIQNLVDAPFNEPDYTQQYIRDDQYVFTTGQTLQIPREPVTRCDGVLRQLHTVKTALRDDAGRIRWTVGVSTDITEREQIEEAMRQAAAQEAIVQAQAVALAELSTPLIPVTETVVVMPLIGAIDSNRAYRVLDTLLQGVASHHASITIIDITGVPIVDTQVANVLLQAAQAVKLLGAEVVLTGIRPEVAQTLVGLGVNLGGIVTHGTLKTGIDYALRKTHQGSLVG